MTATQPRDYAALMIDIKRYVSQMSPAEATRCALTYEYVNAATHPVEHLLREMALRWLCTLRASGDL